MRRRKELNMLSSVNQQTLEGNMGERKNKLSCLKQESNKTYKI
jgi:hypothetical protein